jgi:hypothetical protein
MHYIIFALVVTTTVSATEHIDSRRCFFDFFLNYCSLRRRGSSTSITSSSPTTTTSTTGC